MITGIAFTGYSVSNLEAARSFYEGLLGLSPSVVVVGPPEHGLVEYDLGPSTLSITNRLSFLRPSPSGGVAVLEVSEMSVFAAKLERQGVGFLVPLTKGPSCLFAMIQDPDGNLIGLHQRG
jgi:catechol 2,3-dioxygenase-like lactoylglutathione lyase family enzyme